MEIWKSLCLLIIELASWENIFISFVVNSLLTRGDLSSANNLCKHFWQNGGPDLDPNCLTLLSIIVLLKKCFEKVNFEKKVQTITKALKITQHAKSSNNEVGIDNRSVLLISSSLCRCLSACFTMENFESIVRSPLIWSIWKGTALLIETYSKLCPPPHKFWMGVDIQWA